LSYLLPAALAALLALTLAACGSDPHPLDAEKLRRARMMEELMTGKGAIGGDFSLTAHDGTHRSLVDFRGKVVLLYFGYTYCPDVCPTDLMEVAALLRALGKAADEVQALYVTVDPERDTPAQLATYVDRAGRYAGSLPPGTRVERLADVIRERLAAQPS
jgi:cytochrome oxidase Cu insertion factor (SCO1/SenC/PrrC family)